MLKKMALTFAALSAVALVGCGGGDDTTGGSEDMAGGGGAGDMAMPVYKVQSGTYAVSAIVSVEDSCMQGLTSSNFTTLQVTNDGAGNLSLGDLRTPTSSVPQYDPQAYSQGTGMFTDLYHATTTMTTHVTATTDGTCTYDLTRTNVVTVKADNTLGIDFMQARSNVASACTPVNTSCTSHYTYTVTKQ
jgi:hypothetical protein